MPAPMTTTRAASGDVLKRNLLGPVARTVATVGRTAWSAILLSPAGPHPDRRTPRLHVTGAGRCAVAPRRRGSMVYLSRIRSALVSIFFFSLAVRLPFLTCWDARAFAFAACDLSGIGYFFSLGRPKSDFGSALRFLVVSSAISDLLSTWVSTRCSGRTL